MTGYQLRDCSQTKLRPKLSHICLRSALYGRGFRSLVSFWFPLWDPCFGHAKESESRRKAGYCTTCDTCIHHGLSNHEYADWGDSRWDWFLKFLWNKGSCWSPKMPCRLFRQRTQALVQLAFGGTLHPHPNISHCEVAGTIVSSTALSQVPPVPAPRVGVIQVESS